MAKDLKGTKTHGNLKDAFAGESQANRRYLYFAKIADVEGYPEIASNFRERSIMFTIKRKPRIEPNGRRRLDDQERSLVLIPNELMNASRSSV